VATTRLDSLRAYARAWQQSGEHEIRALIEECWTPTSIYVNPLTDAIRGVDGLTQVIVDYPVLFPDAQVRPGGEPDARASYLCYPWRLSSTARIRVLGEDHGLVLEGTDVMEFDADHKIKTVVSFFGKAPLQISS